MQMSMVPAQNLTNATVQTQFSNSKTLEVKKLSPSEAAKLVTMPSV